MSEKPSNRGFLSPHKPHLSTNHIKLIIKRLSTNPSTFPGNNKKTPWNSVSSVVKKTINYQLKKEGRTGKPDTPSSHIIKKTNPYNAS